MLNLTITKTEKTKRVPALKDGLKRETDTGRASTITELCQGSEEMPSPHLRLQRLKGGDS